MSHEVVADCFQACSGGATVHAGGATVPVAMIPNDRRDACPTANSSIDGRQGCPSRLGRLAACPYRSDGYFGIQLRLGPRPAEITELSKKRIYFLETTESDLGLARGPWSMGIENEK